MSVTVGAVVLAGVVELCVQPGVTPSWRDLVWHPFGGIVLAGNLAMTWLIVYLHELGHTLTAKAAGVPSRIGLSTRLQFLAAQTDVSGVSAEPCRVRVTVYLAGVAVNALLAAGGILARGWLDPDGIGYSIAGVVALIAMLLVLPQYGIFMRTDFYFVAQDLDRLSRPLRRRLGLSAIPTVASMAVRPRRSRPLRGAPPKERRVVRGYSVVLALGTAGCLFAAATVTYPMLVELAIRAAHTLVMPGASAAALMDAGATLVLLVLMQLLWLRTWWRRHGQRNREPSPSRSPRGGDTTTLLESAFANSRSWRRRASAGHNPPNAKRERVPWHQRDTLSFRDLGTREAAERIALEWLPELGLTAPTWRIPRGPGGRRRPAPIPSRCAGLPR